MLKLRQVMASTSDRKSRFGDDRKTAVPPFFSVTCWSIFSQNFGKRPS
jgi:hypothetical protein